MFGFENAIDSLKQVYSQYIAFFNASLMCFLVFDTYVRVGGMEIMRSAKGHAKKARILSLHYKYICYINVNACGGCASIY